MRLITVEHEHGTAAGFSADCSRNSLGNYLKNHIQQSEAVMTVLRRESKKAALLKSMWVDKHYRGIGVGTDLLANFCKTASKLGSEAICLICDLDEEQQKGFDLVRFYEAAGFKIAVSHPYGPMMINSPELCLMIQDQIAMDRKIIYSSTAGRSKRFAA